MTELPADDDDGYMHRLAHALFRHLVETSEQGDLMPALFAARHVLNWEVGGDPEPADVEAFAEAFPAWGTIDAVCDGIRPIWFEGGEAHVEHAGLGQPLVPLCLAFLDDYARLRRDGEEAAAGLDAEPDAAAPRPEPRPARP